MTAEPQRNKADFVYEAMVKLLASMQPLCTDSNPLASNRVEQIQTAGFLLGAAIKGFTRNCYSVEARRDVYGTLRRVCDVIEGKGEYSKYMKMFGAVDDNAKHLRKMLSMRSVMHGQPYYV